MLTNNVPDTDYGIPDPQETVAIAYCCECGREIYPGDRYYELDPGYTYCHAECEEEDE